MLSADYLTNNGSTATATATATAGAAGQEIGRDSMSLADRWACTLLAENGEDLVGRIRYPQYLLLPKLILILEENENKNEDDEKNINSNSSSFSTMLPSEWSWWAMRTVLTQQRILAGRSATLRHRLLSLTKTVLDHYQHSGQQQEATAATLVQSGKQKTNLAAAALLEAAMMETAYGHVQQAKLYTDQALAYLELQAELGGALGTRTVHQQDPRAQLILNLSVSSSSPLTPDSDNNVEGVDGAILDAFLVEGSGSNQE